MLKRLFALICLSLLLPFLGEAALWVQRHLFWPGIFLRSVLLVFVAPGLALRGWADLHLGFLPPVEVVYFLGLALVASMVAGLQRLSRWIGEEPHRGRRAFLLGVATAGMGVCGLRAHGRLESANRLWVVNDLPRDLNGLKIVLVADLHRGPVVSESYLQGVVQQVNALEPDLVVMPGDFVSKSSSYYPSLSRVLAELKPTIGSVATLGNHDHWAGAEGAAAALKQAGVRLLHNESLVVSADRRLCEQAEEGLWVVGVDDLWHGEPDLERALQGVPASMPRLLLSHHPDLAEDEQSLTSEPRIDLQLSGHTHGGQVVLPGVGAVASGSAYGLKYLSGLVQGPRWPVFVTRGVGTSIFPVRVGASPEIVCFQLEASS